MQLMLSCMVMTCFSHSKMASDENFYLFSEKTTSISQVSKCSFLIISAPVLNTVRCSPCKYRDEKVLLEYLKCLSFSLYVHIVDI